MSLRTEGLLLHTFCGIPESFQVISGHFRSFQVIAHGLVRAWSLSNRSSKLCAVQAEDVLC